jgi:cytochrome c-type biogenesis protein CcmH/NrfG
LDPAFGFAPYSIGQACTQLARHDDAIAALSLAENLTGRSPEVLAALAYAQAMPGQLKNARNMMDELIRLSSQRYVC